MDCYTLLGVSRTATSGEIKRAFCLRAVQYHPDKNKNPDASEMFRKIHEAYSTLSDPMRKRNYDWSQFGDISWDFSKINEERERGERERGEREEREKGESFAKYMESCEEMWGTLAKIEAKIAVLHSRTDKVRKDTDELRKNIDELNEGLNKVESCVYNYDDGEEEEEEEKGDGEKEEESSS